MHFRFLKLFFLALAAIFSLNSATYTLSDTFSPSNFADSFSFYTDADPTHGFVKYVSKDASQALLSQSSSSVTIGVDSTTTNPNGGRNAVRLTSLKSWNRALLIADVSRMPTGCGLWPALWLVGPSWPNAGEIDVIEGVNMQPSNAMTLHTSAGCAVDNTTSAFSGSMTTPNCDVNAPGQDKNAGCQIVAPPNTTVPSFGSAFNAAKGGRYAMEWTSHAIKIWFFPKSSNFAAAGKSMDPSTFGQPMATFAGSGCNFDQHFQNLSVVINTDFCGDWAGNVWQSGGCAAATGVDTCEKYVGMNPQAFKDAYWQFDGMWIYQDDGKAAMSSSSSSAAASPSSAASSSNLVSTATGIPPLSGPAFKPGPASAASSATSSSAVSTATGIPPLSGPAFQPGPASATSSAMMSSSILSSSAAFSSAVASSAMSSSSKKHSTAYQAVVLTVTASSHSPTATGTHTNISAYSGWSWNSTSKGTHSRFRRHSEHSAPSNEAFHGSHNGTDSGHHPRNGTAHGSGKDTVPCDRNATHGGHGRHNGTFPSFNTTMPGYGHHDRHGEHNRTHNGTEHRNATESCHGGHGHERRNKTSHGQHECNSTQTSHISSATRSSSASASSSATGHIATSLGPRMTLHNEMIVYMVMFWGFWLCYAFMASQFTLLYVLGPVSLVVAGVVLGLVQIFTEVFGNREQEAEEVE